MNFFKVLLRPDSEEKENAGQAVIAEAANRLQVGEFQLLQLAYREWFGDDVSESAMDGLFKSYMLESDVPFWARQYARRIVELDDVEDLNYNDPSYHRYDREYRLRARLDARSICLVLGVAAMMVGGGIVISKYDAGPNVSIFPPYLSDTDLQR